MHPETDLIERIIEFTERCFKSVEFVLCTNLLEFGERKKKFLVARTFSSVHR